MPNQANRTGPSAHPMRRTRAATACLAAAIALSPCATLAAPPPVSTAVGEDNSAGGTQVSTGLLGTLQRSNFLLGDLFGLRTALSRYGVSLAVQETSEVLGNVTGGVHKGIAYDGLTQAILQLDTQRAFGWYGGLLNVSAFQIHGRNLSTDNLLNLQTASGIEADRATRLWEAWYDQKLLEDDRLSIRVGQQSADQEFIVNPNGAYFVNTMFGWPVTPSYDLPGGGPAYPLSAPAIRIRYRPVNAVNILVGVFSGSPAPSPHGDPQRSNRSGVSLPLNRGELVFVEFQYSYPSLGGMVEPGENSPLGHTYRIGASYDSERFDDLRLDTTRTPLASPDSNGNPLRHRGNVSLYAVADQQVWRDSAIPNRSVSVFGRIMGTPQSDRNLVDFSVNGGVVYHSPSNTRPDDTVGLGGGYAHVSARAAGIDRDNAAYNLTNGVISYSAIRSSETFLEATYQYQARPWWQLQPDLQYVFKPGGGLANPLRPDQHVKNELILGLRTNILF